MRHLRYVNRLTTAVKSTHENTAILQVLIKQFMFRQIASLESYRNFKNVKEIIRLSLRNNKLLEQLLTAPITLKYQSANLLKTWIYQCECVFVQRLQRSQQMFCLYSRLWDERRLKQLLKQIQQHATLRTRDLLLASIGIGVYDWQNNRIPESEILDHKYDLDYIQLLKEQTICDDNCHDRNQLKTYDTWTVFIQQDDLLVWRRMDLSGYYEYKVYGRYDDVTAEDFLNVQVDTGYRKKWDTTAIELEVIETDGGSNSDIVYWEMLWPKLFNNRDYVFNRRYLVETDTKTMFVVNKSTEHPACPSKTSTFRIKDYWSVMVIKSFTEFDQLGIEFSLTYFDNPGVNIPATVTTWVAMKAMPDFLSRLREASKQYKSYCSQEGVQCYYDVKKLTNPIIEKEETNEPSGWELFAIDDVIIDNTIYEAQIPIRRWCKCNKEAKQDPPSQNDVNKQNTVNNPEVEQDKEQQKIKHNFWRYLHPTYYFS